MATLWTDCALGCSSWFVILLHSLLHPWFSHWVWDKPAVCLFVHLRVGFCFFCLFLGAEVLSAASLLHRPPPHCVLTSSWDCQLLHKKLMCLLMVRNHLSILLSTYQIQCGDELKWQLWLRWSDRLLCVAFSVRSPEWVPPPTSPLFPLLHWFLITAILLTSHLSRLLFGVLIQSFSYCGAWGFVWQAGLRANTHTVTYTA